MFVLMDYYFVIDSVKSCLVCGCTVNFSFVLYDNVPPTYNYIISVYTTDATVCMYI